MIDTTTRKRLLSLARTTIGIHLQGDDLELPHEFPDPTYAQLSGVFIRLFLNDELRGGFGSYSPEIPVAQAVVEYTTSAAFGDPRFQPVTEAEFDDVIIEIGIVSIPQIIIWKSEAELLDAITPGEHGAALESNAHTANFLPVMWSEIPEKQEFLRQLSLKAGLAADAWKTATIKTYTIERFSEADFESVS